RRDELSGILRRQPPLRPRRERRRPDAEEPLALRLEPLGEEARRVLRAPVLGEPARELLRGLFRLELRELRRLVGEERPRLQLEERGDEDEELAAGLEVDRLEALAERDDDLGHVHLGRRELLLQDERQEEVERALEGVEVELELAGADGHPARLALRA